MNNLVSEGATAITTSAGYEIKKQKMPHEIYNWIIFKCFDTCISNFENKTLDNNE